MADRTTLLVVGGTSGIGLEIARRAVARGEEVILSGRDPVRAAAVADEIGGGARGIALDIGQPDSIAAALAEVGKVDHLVLAAIERDANTVKDYDVRRAVYLTTMKLVGYLEVIHTLLPRMSADASIVLFGGLAKDRPYPGSTTVSTINGGVTGMVHTLVVELSPVRVNAIHPGIVGDSPFWSDKPDHVLAGYVSRTPTGQLATMADVAEAAEFLLRNRSVNGVHLNVDGGWLLT
jgi:NAD(P)-dependent dehydrogenase (short-subunit alcohol dehydrogenase family)